MVLRSHASNVAMTGYVEHVADSDLARLAHDHDLVCVVNLGGGSLVDPTERGLPECPTISRAVSDGADLVLASGDKIIGGRKQVSLSEKGTRSTASSVIP